MVDITSNRDPSRNTDRVELRFVKLSNNARTPTRGSVHSAGLDLYSACDCVVKCHDKHLVKTDIQIELPDGCYGRVAPRSGLSVNHFVSVGAGVIDRDYRGNVGILMYNFGHEEFVVRKGDRIAQLILEKIFYPDIVEMEMLGDTTRGGNGFGSTGV